MQQKLRALVPRHKRRPFAPLSSLLWEQWSNFFLTGTSGAHTTHHENRNLGRQLNQSKVHKSKTNSLGLAIAQHHGERESVFTLKPRKSHKQKKVLESCFCCFFAQVTCEKTLFNSGWPQKNATKTNHKKIRRNAPMHKWHVNSPGAPQGAPLLLKRTSENFHWGNLSVCKKETVQKHEICWQKKFRPLPLLQPQIKFTRAWGKKTTSHSRGKITQAIVLHVLAMFLRAPYKNCL